MSNASDPYFPEKGQSMETDIDVLERLLATRHSCRGFRPHPVAKGTIDRIVSVAQKSASWCNTQPWPRDYVGRGNRTISRRAARPCRYRPGQPGFSIPARISRRLSGAAARSRVPALQFPGDRRGATVTPMRGRCRRTSSYLGPRTSPLCRPMRDLAFTALWIAAPSCQTSCLPRKVRRCHNPASVTCRISRLHPQVLRLAERPVS